MRRVVLELGVWSLLGTCLLGGCGSGSVASAVRPQAASANQALGETPQDMCRDVSQGAKPLVVDWKPEQRGDLEVAMGQGIAVVAYDCKRLELLSDCKAEGSYGFKGVVLKQQLIRLNDADEIKANLPLSGAVLAAQLEAELSRGTTLDLATALVGNLTSTRMSVGKGDISGRCQGATHFVRGANVGAFVMQTGERAKAATAAALFGAGVHAGSESSKLARSEDGSIDSCKQSTSDSPKPPGNCGALVRVHLLPISAEAAPDAMTAKTLRAGEKAEPKPTVAEVTCPQGLVAVEGKCAKPKAEDAHECQRDDLGDCEAQCNKNQPASCARLAALLAKGKGGAPDPTKAATLYDKACKLDQGGACSDLGIMHMTGQGAQKTPAKAAQLFEQACKLGEANGCFNLGNVYYDGVGVAQDKKRAFSLFEQACNAGKPAGCINVGTMYDDGEGVTQDSAKAFALFKKACEGDEAAGCTNLAYMYAEGKGTGVDQAAALRFYEKACALANAKGCEYAGTRYVKGEGTAKDPTKGKALLQKACDAGSNSACTAARDVGTK
jgi:TPR repeat protein